MPSLKALGAFKASFSRVGAELQTLAELDIPPDDLPLPEQEPAGGAAPSLETALSGTEVSAPSGGAADFIDSGDLGDLLGGADGLVPGIPGLDENGSDAAAQDDAGLGAFLDSIPNDFAASGGGDIPPDDAALPEDLLKGFADDIEAERAVSPELPAESGLDLDSLDLGGEAESSLDDSGGPGDLGGSGEEGADLGLNLGDLDLGALPGLDAPGSDDSLDLPGEEASLELPAEGGFDLDSLDLGGEAGSGLDDSGGPGDLGGSGEEGADLGLNLGDLDLGALPGLDAPGSDDSLGLPGEEASLELPAEGGLDLDSLDLGGEAESLEDLSPLEGEDAGAGQEDGFDLGGETLDPDAGAALEEVSGDSFDNFTLDTGALAKDFDISGGDAGTDGFGDSSGSLDEFSLPGIDEVFEGKSTPLGKGTAPSKAAGKAAARETAAGEAAEEVEEIRLSEEELEQFQKTLSSYPLNLRVACEELIAEQAVAPDQMSRLVRLLVTGASARETAALAGKILGRAIPIPKGFEKKTGEALEAEQASFAYIFVRNFLPVFRLFMMIALVLICAGYLGWKFIYTPVKAEGIYQLGYERIGAGEYGRANERFREAFRIHEKKSWFYKYAEAFRDARQYLLAEEKYQELLNYTASKNKRGIPEKQAVLDYANLATNYLINYKLADDLLRRHILDYAVNDRSALLALGDNALAWGEVEKERYEDAREAYARLMERYGRSDPLLERMLKYFIRTDNLGETLSLHSYFMASAKRKISAGTLAELGGYFLDKRLEEARGVPNEYLEYIQGMREILLRAVRQDPLLPESYYHLARYYNYFENFNDEELTLQTAVRAFAAAREETPKRLGYHIDTLRRYGSVLVSRKDFFAAQENLIRGINLYEDGLSRTILKPAPQFGRLYADLGDLEYFAKEGDMQGALDYYRLAEQNGWAPPEIQYRMGSAHYQLRQWGPALERFFTAYRELPPNRRILYALGNVSYMRGNYFAAQGYYDRLLGILEADRARFPQIMPTGEEEQLDLVERLCVAQNNLGVTLEALTGRTGSNSYRSRARGLYSDSERAWDVLTRNPQSMIRMRPSPDINAPGVNAAYLNVQNSLHPVEGYEPLFYILIDKDMLEPSPWEDLAPPGYRLSGSSVPPGSGQ